MFLDPLWCFEAAETYNFSHKIDFAAAILVAVILNISLVQSRMVIPLYIQDKVEIILTKNKHNRI